MGMNILPFNAQGMGHGRSVAVYGNVVAVGTPREQTVAPNAGSAYLFDKRTGRVLHELQPTDPQDGKMFGQSIALPSGTDTLDAALNQVSVGAPESYHNGAKTGAVYVFAVASGVQLFKLVGNDL